MDLTSKIHKVHENDPRILDAATVLHLATHGGAKALGIKDLGLLEPGYLADLILIGVRRPSLSPMYNPVSHLVYAVRGGDVQMVWVEGRLIVQDGRPLTIDTEEIKARVQEITGRLSELT
jgi:5-methylthioadenosine/S-adenosylhomocysteine deaminase